MDLLHGLASLLHGRQRLAIDVGGLNRVDLLLQGPNLCHCLVQRMFMSLLALQGSLCRYSLVSHPVMPVVTSACSVTCLGLHTIFVRADVLSRKTILLVDLVLQMFLALL